uniref:NADH-quinone oxidoreductase subunit N n=1 Tax=uncultured Alphaproteobacteria bacterium TaxID=91750 RepID=A0A6G8F2M6_9PROT|nr:NADH-quinone oxidoreductase subunit N [uncultured Alphaproteobacteria bacterium]
MLTDYIALLPETVLFFGLLFMIFIKVFRHTNTPKTFYTVSRFFLLLSMLLTAVFYNHNAGEYFYNNNFTTLFKLLIYLFTLIWGYLSVKRFVSKGMPSFVFYEMLMFNVLGFSLAVSAHSLLFLFLGLAPCFVGNYLLLKIERPADSCRECSCFLGVSILFMLLFAAGIGILYYYLNTLDYKAVEEVLNRRSGLIWQYHLAFALIVCALLFMLGAAPLHFWFAGAVGGSILPVAGYLAIVPVFAYFSCLVNVSVNVFYPLLGWFNKVFVCFGLLSVFIGAVGANSESNLRKIFAYGGLYYLGVMLLVLFPLNDQSLLAAFTYLLVYAVAVCGIYTVFYGYRCKGEYMPELGDIRGVATQRPFLSAALLVFMISLIGTPPLLGFLGKLAVINSLVLSNEFLLIGAVLLAMLILVYAYLKIITVVYFEPRDNNFDIVDKGVYICLLINIVLIAIAIVNPKYLMHDVEQMLVAVF